MKKPSVPAFQKYVSAVSEYLAELGLGVAVSPPASDFGRAGNSLRS